MDAHALNGQVRWVEMQTDKNRVGEIYRVVADARGAFVQPALFEAFGLTVVEAMSSGLPVFATLHGGPSEIVEDGVSGFHIDPNRGDEAAVSMCSFLERSAHSPELWKTLSRQAVARVQERYNWHLYASRLLELSRIYGFWKYITSLERDETARYLEMFYALMFRPLARTIGERETADP
jgi:sucrose synthase